MLTKKQKGYNIVSKETKWRWLKLDKINIIMNSFKEIYEKEETLGKLAFKGEYEEFGISEIHCVDLIGKIKDPNVTKISQGMNMTRGAVSKICKKLLNNNLINKYKNTDNNKEIYFKLTESGDRLYKYHEIKHKQWEERNDKFFKDIDKKNQEVIVSFLKRFSNYLDEIIEEEERKNMNLHLKAFSIPQEILKWGDSQPAHQRQHIGTHIDCYNLSNIELPSEIDVKVIDVRGLDIIDTNILENVKVEENSFVIFRTGCLEKYGYGSEEYFNSESKPYLTRDLVDKLLEFNVKLIGIDLSGIQHGKNHVAIDKYVESKGSYVVENICNLDKVSFDFKASLKWLQLEGATAIKVEIETI